MNQTTHELDSLKLINTGSFSSGNVLDITGGVLKQVDSVPVLDVSSASVTKAFNTNSTGYEPLVYGDILTFSNTAFDRDTYSYSHFVEIDNVVVSFVSDANRIAVVASPSDNAVRMNVLSDTDAIALAMDNYHYQDSVLNIKGVLTHFGNEDLLRIVSANDIEVASSPLRNVQDTTIFQAFNWSLDSVNNQLETIRDNGFKTIQLSPLQPHIGYYGGSEGWSNWWKLYQPLGLCVSYGENQTEIGTSNTKNTLTQLTARAKSMGINIIVDVVANHLGGENYYTPNGSVDYFEHEIYSNNLFHNVSDSPNDGNTYSIVRGHIGDYPDLKTEDSRVQNRVIQMLKDYIDCGVTGFRFDAAKHIETPDDGDYASNFWPNVLGQVTSYANSNYHFKPYYYGEILSPGNYRSWGSYTQYMSITDSYRGTLAREAVNGSNLSKLDGDYNGYACGDPSKTVLWAESHDNYAGNGHESIYMEQQYIDKTYAIQASRAGAATLYLARPNNNANMGDYSTAYNNSVIKAVNKFHNELVGASEYIKRDNGYFMNVRLADERAGAVIVNISNSSANTINLNVDDGYMIPDGTYTELISGNSVVVDNGICQQKFSPNGVMVLLKDVKTKYGLSVNGTPLVASRVDDYDGFQQYKIVSHKFHKNELLTLYDFENNASWIVNIDSYSFDSNVSQYIQVVNNKYKVLKDFTADVYIKIKYEQDQIYFGLTQMAVSKSSINMEAGDSDNVIITNASGNITATSSNTSVATVKKEGTTLIVTGVANGSATITVSDGETTKTISVTIASDITINVSPGAWTSDNAVIFAWVWGNGISGQWVKLTSNKFVVPNGITGLKLVRMPNGSTQGDWDTCWNDTGDITYQSGKTLTFSSWGSGKTSVFNWA